MGIPPFEDVSPMKMVVFHCYFSLPVGSFHMESRFLPNISCLARPQHSFFFGGDKVDDSQDSFAIITWKKRVIFWYHLLYVPTLVIHINIFK